MRTLRILAAALLGACWLVLLTAAGSDAASCSLGHAPTGRAYVSYSDPDDPQSWRDHEVKIDPGELRALCARTSTTGSVTTGDDRGSDDGGGTATWALVGGAGVVAAGSTVLVLRRRPG